MSLVIKAMHDKSHSVYQRYQCCYVISGSEYEPGIPDLIQVLRHDESETMRSVAAEALVQFPKSTAAHRALLQAAREETSPAVRDVLIRRKVIPAPESSRAPAPARTMVSGEAKNLAIDHDARLATFDVAQGEGVAVFAERAAGSLEPHLDLYAPGGGLVTDAGFGSIQATLSVSNLSAGTYTLFVSDYEGGETGNINILLAVMPAAGSHGNMDEQARAVPRREGIGQFGRLKYSPDQIRSKPAEYFLERMVPPEPGYDSFAAFEALIQKAKESDADTRRAIICSVVKAMNDKNRAEYPRWLCCKVLSGIGDERAVPDLIRVLLHDELEIVRYVAAGELGELYKKSNSAAAHDGLLQSARKETSPRVRETLARLLGQEMPGSPASPQQQVVSQPGDSVYTPDEIRRTVETFLERMLQPDQFVAMNALAQKAKESDAVSRRSILSLVIAAMQDKRRPVYQRWQCCYVLSGSGDEQGVPALIQVLLHDESEIMRSVAAEALADFPKSAAAHDALLQSARQETSPRVREVLIRRLGQEMPPPPPSPPPVPAGRGDK